MGAEIKVRLNLAKFDVAPEDLTTHLGIEPSKTWVAGESILGGVRTYEEEQNIWKLEPGTAEIPVVETHRAMTQFMQEYRFEVVRSCRDFLTLAGKIARSGNELVPRPDRPPHRRDHLHRMRTLWIDANSDGEGVLGAAIPERVNYGRRIEAGHIYQIVSAGCNPFRRKKKGDYQETSCHYLAPPTT